MTYEDWLLARAGAHWEAGEPLPTDLFMAMTNNGLDVDKEEKIYHSLNGND